MGRDLNGDPHGVSAKTGGNKIKQKKARSLKQKGVLINGPKTTLKTLKPNVGRLGLFQNKALGASNGGSKLDNF